MKTIQKIFLTISLLLSSLVFAQNDLKARIEFEEAEKQFNENNFSDALQSLEKTEVFVGKWTPKVSFMKIESLNNIADLSDLENVNTAKLVKEVNLYIDYCNKQKDNVVMEKFKVVYAIDEELNQLKKQASNRNMPEYIEGFNQLNKKNYLGAMNSWIKAAEKGNSSAMYYIGTLYHFGEGVPESRDKAFEWYHKGDKAGDASSAYTIGRAFFSGNGVTKDYTKAIEYFKKASDRGDTEAMYQLGLMYQRGLGYTEDLFQAFNWYLKAAQRGHGKSMNKVGYFYDSGKGVEKNETKGLEWYFKGAKAGDSASMTSLGITYSYNNAKINIKQDYSKAMEWFLKSADKEDSSAMKHIAIFYQEGKGVAKDYTKAIEWHLKAVEKGNLNSIKEMATIYEEGGYGIKRDKKKAAELRTEYEQKN